MRTNRSLVGLAAVAVLTIAGAVSAFPPGLTVIDLDGQQVDLSALADGKPTLVVMWATWCPHCAAQIPNVNLAQEKYGSQGLQILAVNPGIRDSVARARRYVEVMKVDYPVYFDLTGVKTRHAFEIPGMPWMLLYDTEGNKHSEADAVQFDKIEELLGIESSD